jgi:outer membrane protein OmpA-like peptidoglycan-associated protein
MKGARALPVLVILACVSQVGCPPPAPVVTVPAVVEKTSLLAVEVLSTPPQATISLKDRTLGLTPQSISLDTASDLLQLKAVLGESEAAEKRIRFLSPEKAEVHFLFGKNQSPLARSLGLSKVLVFDYGEGITFDVNQHELRPEFASLLERQAEMLMAHFTNLDIYVCGHTDSSGNSNHNLALSLARAQTVAESLVAKGVPRARLKVQGFGSAFPLASNDTVDGKALNRRTEIVLPQ